MSQNVPFKPRLLILGSLSSGLRSSVGSARLGFAAFVLAVAGLLLFASPARAQSVASVQTNSRYECPGCLIPVAPNAAHA